MSSGDPINGLQTSGVSNFNFQPAVGVNVLLTTVNAWGNYSQIYNGADFGILISPALTDSTDKQNVKIIINNTNYLQMRPSADGQFYSGIEM